jgi:hypothetical protein
MVIYLDIFPFFPIFPIFPSEFQFSHFPILAGQDMAIPISLRPMWPPLALASSSSHGRRACGRDGLHVLHRPQLGFDGFINWTTINLMVL